MFAILLKLTISSKIENGSRLLSAEHQKFQSMTKAIPLYEGTFSVGTDKIFRRIDKKAPPYKASLKLSIHPFLIRNGDNNTLFDAGIGDLFGHETTIETLLRNLEQESVSDYEITDIMLSHLHFDHMGGLANRENGYLELTFSDAKLWVSGNAWKKLYSNIDEEDNDIRDFFHFLDNHADIHFIEDYQDILPDGFRAEKISGHTEYHQALYYERGDDKYVMAGDVIGTRGAINRTYAAKYDFEPKQSQKIRNEIQKLSFSEGHIIMAYHETDHPLFKLTDFDDKKGYKIKNITS